MLGRKYHVSYSRKFGETSPVLRIEMLGIKRLGEIVEIAIKLGAFDPVERESPFAVELAQGMSIGEKMDFAVQKAVELGVASIRPLIAERSVVKLAGERADKRVLHAVQASVPEAQ